VDEKTGPMFEIKDPQNPNRAKKKISSLQAAGMAAIAMGEDFAGSVKACLYPTKTWAKARELVADGKVKEGYEKALEEYYISVYSP